MVHEYVSGPGFSTCTGQAPGIPEGFASPYAYWEGQKGLAAGLIPQHRPGDETFIQLPTGVGKTLSTVFPSLKAMGKAKGDKFFI